MNDEHFWCDFNYNLIHIHVTFQTGDELQRSVAVMIDCFPQNDETKYEMINHELFNKASPM